jgi:hypothetical protein
MQWLSETFCYSEQNFDHHYEEAPRVSSRTKQKRRASSRGSLKSKNDVSRTGSRGTRSRGGRSRVSRSRKSRSSRQREERMIQQHQLYRDFERDNRVGMNYSKTYSDDHHHELLGNYVQGHDMYVTSPLSTLQQSANSQWMDKSFASDYHTPSVIADQYIPQPSISKTMDIPSTVIIPIDNASRFLTKDNSDLTSGYSPLTAHIHAPPPIFDQRRAPQNYRPRVEEMDQSYSVMDQSYNEDYSSSPRKKQMIRKRSDEVNQSVKVNISKQTASPSARRFPKLRFGRTTKEDGSSSDNKALKGKKNVGGNMMPKKQPQKVRVVNIKRPNMQQEFRDEKHTNIRVHSPVTREQMQPDERDERHRIRLHSSAIRDQREQDMLYPMSNTHMLMSPLSNSDFQPHHEMAQEALPEKQVRFDAPNYALVKGLSFKKGSAVQRGLSYQRRRA